MDFFSPYCKEIFEYPDTLENCFIKFTIKIDTRIFLHYSELMDDYFDIDVFRAVMKNASIDFVVETAQNEFKHIVNLNTVKWFEEFNRFDEYFDNYDEHNNETFIPISYIYEDCDYYYGDDDGAVEYINWDLSCLELDSIVNSSYSSLELQEFYKKENTGKGDKYFKRPYVKDEDMIFDEFSVIVKKEYSPSSADFYSLSSADFMIYRFMFDHWEYVELSAPSRFRAKKTIVSKHHISEFSSFREFFEYYDKPYLTQQLLYSKLEKDEVIDSMKKAMKIFDDNQSAFARAIGVNFALVSNWVNGKNGISYKTATDVLLRTNGRVNLFRFDEFSA